MMKRYEALKLIQSRLPQIISDLKGLESRLKPEFERRDIRIFDVGIDVIEVAANGTVFPQVTVYGGGQPMLAHDVFDIVKTAVPDFKGGTAYMSGPVPYPVNAVLSLHLLEDIHQASR